jgi:hypothetical protein
MAHGIDMVALPYRSSHLTHTAVRNSLLMKMTVRHPNDDRRRWNATAGFGAGSPAAAPYRRWQAQS